MPRPDYDWERIRAEYEAGASMGELARKHGCVKSAVSQRAKREGWVQDSAAAVQRAVEARLNGVVNTVNPVLKAEAINEAAAQKVEILRKHQAEWERNCDIIIQAMDRQDLELAKLAKMTAEALRIKQEGERRAWCIRDVDAPSRSDDSTITIEFVGDE